MKHLKRTITRQLFLRSCKFVGLNDYQTVVKHFCHHADTDLFKKPMNGPRFETFVPFNQMVESRRDEARRSIVVQVKDKTSYEDLLTYCQKFGNLKNAFYYSTFGNDLLKHFIVVEYDSESDFNSVLNNSKPSNIEQVLPVTTPFLWFCSGVKHPKLNDLPKLRIEPNELPSQDALQKLLGDSDSFDDDIQILYNRTRLGNIGARLRFITALQLEKAFIGIFSHCRVLPFGSSINSFGKLNCDLDLVLQLYTSPTTTTNSRLIYVSKALRGTSRIHSQRHMETMADILQIFLPGCTNTRRILKARVPIIKYTHDVTGLECDLSSSNLSGVYMSELLYLFGAYDWRVCPLVFAVRYWAKETNLTNPTPGKWLTNFMLTLLVLFHLQQAKIIPTLETLASHRLPEDEKIFVDENGEEVRCGFACDLNRVAEPRTVPNEDNLLELMFSFFQFYSSFDFRSNAISLYAGCAITKPFYDPMYIVNPLEKGLNVSRNVSQEECDKFQMMVRTAAWSIECAINSADFAHKKWGLSELILSHVMNRSGFPRTRSMKGVAKFTVKELFDSDGANENADFSHTTKNAKI